ncbi:hypothetical protein [Streptomyces aureus]|uniref:Secreted protein n=1 Tax=Streptomyces aureus TaxID=193461 RepID=A0ABV4SYT6_9ACTN
MSRLLFKFTACAGSLALGIAALATVSPAASATARIDHSPSKEHEAAGAKAADCFWFGPTPRVDADQHNYAFPDTGALYWAAMFKLPKGAYLTFDHEYAHARYQSLNTYNEATNSPTDALNDVSTKPDRGSRNPYLPGAKRTSNAHRSYTATLVGDQPPTDPADRATNTLYAGVPGQDHVTLLYRLYLPDRHTDPTGGAGLPRPALHLADGTTVTGADMCKVVEAEDRETLPLTRLPADTYDALRNQPGKPAGFPAERAPVWRAFYNQKFGLGCIYNGACSGTPLKTGGQFSNKDNEYVSAYVSREFGDVLVLRGKLPVTPATTHRNPRMRSDAELRYWSICTNETYATTRTVGCLYDEQIVTDADGRYTIVLSLPKDRPANATPAHGVNWLSLSPNGDGAGHLDDTYVVLRNMLPSASFQHSVQNTRVPGDERAVMGTYLPTGTYTTTKAFEADGGAAG